MLSETQFTSNTFLSFFSMEYTNTTCKIAIHDAFYLHEKILMHVFSLKNELYAGEFDTPHFSF